MDLRHVDYFGMMGRSAMQQGNYDQGLQFLSMGLDLLQSYPLHNIMHFAAPFLADRAECLWQLGDERAAVQNMTDAINAGLPLGNLNCEVNVIEISTPFCIRKVSVRFQHSFPWLSHKLHPFYNKVFSFFRT